MRIPVIPLFAGKPSHPFVPLGDRTAGPRSAGQGRPSAGACALPLIEASTLAGWRRCGDRAAWRCAVLLLAGTLSVCAGSVDASAQSAPIAGSSAADPYAVYIAEASQRFAIPERWIRAVMAVESFGDRIAISPAGALGLMQLMPATWDELRVRHGLGSDPWQPRANILAGTAYLREMHDRYGSIGGMLASYNAGPARYDRHLATGRALPAETVEYVEKIAPMIDGTDAVPISAARIPVLSAAARSSIFPSRTSGNFADDEPIDEQPKVPETALFTAVKAAADQSTARVVVVDRTALEPSVSSAGDFDQSGRRRLARTLFASGAGGLPE